MIQPVYIAPACCTIERIAMPTLFDPIHFGSIESANRIVMAPLTRDR
jgi:hypothetical protein